MIGIKVELEVKKVLQKIADGESRNLSNFCYHAIKVYVKATPRKTGFPSPVVSRLPTLNLA